MRIYVLEHRRYLPLQNPAFVLCIFLTLSISQRQAGYGTGLAMILYDARCVPFDDIASYEEMGLIDPTNRAPLHPIPVEFSLSPFDDPKPYVQGRFGFDYFFNITDKVLAVYGRVSFE